MLLSRKANLDVSFPDQLDGSIGQYDLVRRFNCRRLIQSLTVAIQLQGANPKRNQRIVKLNFHGVERCHGNGPWLGFFLIGQSFSKHVTKLCGHRIQVRAFYKSTCQNGIQQVADRGLMQLNGDTSVVDDQRT